MKTLNLQCPINPLGYGVAGCNIALELIDRKEVETDLFPLSTDFSWINPEEANKLVTRAQANYNFDYTAPCLKIWHEFAMAERIGSGPFYGYPFFEIDQFDTRRRNNLESCDGVFVASQWAKDIVVQETHHNDSTVHVAPLGVDTNVFSPVHQEKEKYVFFNCGKWEIRKGHDVLLDIFKEAFPDEVDVELWMMCHNPFLTPEKENEWREYYTSDHRVKLLPRVQTHNDVAKVMGMVDCGIFPSRAEGWNLEALEMMAMDKPIIITDYSAHTEFCNVDNSFLIEINQLETAYDGVWFNGDVGNWACIDDNAIEQTIAYMRHCYNNRIVNNSHGLETARQLSWSNTVDTLIRNIKW